MESAVEADLGGLDLMLRILQPYQRALLMGNVRTEIEARLREELDYGLEARHMALYREMLQGEGRIHVPEPVQGLSTRRLLTMTWLEGEPICCLGWPEVRRTELAMTMFRAWYVPFFEYGVLHGDPHLGNYTVQADGALNLLDFGCLRVFPPRPGPGRDRSLPCRAERRPGAGGQGLPHLALLSSSRPRSRTRSTSGPGSCSSRCSRTGARTRSAR